MKGHTEIKSRQCKGMSDPEGTQPGMPLEDTPSCDASFANEVHRGTKFDDPGPDVLGQGKMPEAHTSSDN